MNMVSCACPPLHLHTSRVDLVLCYDLYLTTVVSSCFFSILLLFHLGRAGSCEGSLPDICLYQSRQDSLHCELPPDSYSVRKPEPCSGSVLARDCHAWLRVVLQTPSAHLRHTCPCAACAAEPCHGQRPGQAWGRNRVCEGPAASPPCLGVQPHS